MGPASITVVRELPIDASLVDEVLARLRRDAAGRPRAYWTLGDRGSADLDVAFTAASDDRTPAWVASGRLCDPEQLAAAGIVVEVRVRDAATCTVELRPSGPLGAWWDARLPEFLDLAHAALDELAEELLWHATRGDVTHA
jgi:hypothetical protein